MIRCEGVGKRYDLGAGRARRISDLFESGLRRRESILFWALKDVDLDVHEGDVLGLVGRNGAGKSTLLKLIARVAAPTLGRISLYGRVGSLLEVGTGFHTELTGRENVLLNGVLLGMGRRTVLQRLDDIIEFADIGQFLDVPVKRYSSGMQMRLAFAVAAHLDAEILLVDEVLAVGDRMFQEKCLDKMGEISGSGRTIVFVSHNLGSVRELCNRAIWLDRGRLRLDATPAETIFAYSDAAAAGSGAWGIEPRGDRAVEIVAAEMGAIGGVRSQLEVEDELFIRVRLRVAEVTRGASVSIRVRNDAGVAVLTSDPIHCTPDLTARLDPGEHDLEVRLPSSLLAPGRYYLSAFAWSAFGWLDEAHDVLSVQIDDTSSQAGAARDGVIGLKLPWTHTPVRLASGS